jgi:hypothetical protein
MYMYPKIGRAQPPAVTHYYIGSKEKLRREDKKATGHDGDRSRDRNQHNTLGSTAMYVT